MGSSVYWEQRASSVKAVAVIVMLGTETSCKAREMLSQMAVKNAKDSRAPWKGLGVVATQWRFDLLQGSRMMIWTLLSSSSFFNCTSRCQGRPSRSQYGASGITKVWAHHIMYLHCSIQYG